MEQRSAGIVFVSAWIVAEYAARGIDVTVTLGSNIYPRDVPIIRFVEFVGHYIFKAVGQWVIFHQQSIEATYHHLAIGHIVGHKQVLTGQDGIILLAKMAEMAAIKPFESIIGGGPDESIGILAQ